MRFPLSFTRVKPAAGGSITLGADGDPNTAGPGSTVLKPGPNVTNLFSGRFTNSSGWPAQRLAVAYRYEGAGVLEALPCTVYFYDAASNYWYTLEDAKKLTATKVTFCDVVSLLGGAQTSTTLGTPSQGSIEAYVRVGDAGAAPNGSHIISVGTDSSLF